MRVVAQTWCCVICLVTVCRVLLWYHLRWMRPSCQSHHARLSHADSRLKIERLRWCCMAVQSSAAHLAPCCWCCATYDGRLRSSPKPASITLMKSSNLTAVLLSRLDSYSSDSVASFRVGASALRRYLAAGRHELRCVHWRVTLIHSLRRTASL